MKWSVSEHTIELAKQYIEEGRILSVKADKEHHSWQAEVLGSRLYFVTLDGSPKEEDVCQCPFWQKHHYCKHTVAVELYLREKEVNRLWRGDAVPANFEEIKEHSGRLFTKELAHLAPENPLRKKSRLHFGYEITQLTVAGKLFWGLGLKIGKAGQRLYKVQNLPLFFNSYVQEDLFAVNKQHSFALDHALMPEEDRQILDRWRAFSRDGKLLADQYRDYDKNRVLLLPPTNAWPFVEQLEKTGHLEYHLSAEASTVLVPQEELPCRFTLTKNGEKFTLLVDKKFSAYYPAYEWAVGTDKIWLFSARQAHIYGLLAALEEKEGEQSLFVFTESELSTLFYEALPVLKELGPLDVADELKEMLNLAKLQSVYSLWKAKGKIMARIDYHYGEAVFSTNPRVERGTEKTTIRDQQGEMAAREQLSTLGFSFAEDHFEKPLPQGHALYRFFTYEVNFLKAAGIVRIGKKLRELFTDSSTFSPKFSVRLDKSWLDIQFDVSGINRSEIPEIVQALKRHEAYFVLDDGAVLNFDEEFIKSGQILNDLEPKSHAEQTTFQLPQVRGLQVQALLSQTSESTFEESFENLTDDLLHPEKFTVNLPDQLHAKLRRYQIEGFRWLKMLGHYHLGGILADEMGLGKTIQAITYILSEFEERDGTDPFLIVAPASLVYNWQKEFEKFAPILKTQVIMGRKEERVDFLAQAQAQVLITSYASFRQDEEEYRDLKLAGLFLDEAQMVKNSESKTTQSFRRLHISPCFALSGTPIENNLNELWSLFQIILPGLLPNKTLFGQLSLDRIREIIHPFVLRREKDQVLRDLPEKLENNVYSQLTDEQKKVYLAYLEEMQQTVQTMDSQTFKKNRFNILAGLTRLRQICCDPHLLLPDYQGSSGKLEQLKDLVLQAKNNGKRMLIFSQFTKMLDIISAELATLDIETFYLSGQTKVSERLKMVDRFNAGERDAFLISLKAGGTGLNLTGADTIILYDLWWNPAVEDQAAGRAHRIGQKKVVEVWRMIASGTIEEKMDQLQAEKRELFSQVLSGKVQESVKLNEEDIRDILLA